MGASRGVQHALCCAMLGCFMLGCAAAPTCGMVLGAGLPKSTVLSVVTAQYRL